MNLVSNAEKSEVIMLTTVSKGDIIKYVTFVLDVWEICVLWARESAPKA